jgi:glutamine amidotransferase
MVVGVVGSPVANVASVVYAFDRLGVDVVVTCDEDEIRRADRVVLPGVGSAGAGMTFLTESGLGEVVKSLAQPVMGICLGMQIMFDQLDESGGVRGLGIFEGRVRELPDQPGPLPHMGWNQVRWSCGNEMSKGVSDEDSVYFVHSYAAGINHAVGVSEYNGAEFGAVVVRENFVGVQFHPERSGLVGSRLLVNFLEFGA